MQCINQNMKNGTPHITLEHDNYAQSVTNRQEDARTTAYVLKTEQARYAKTAGMIQMNIKTIYNNGFESDAEKRATQAYRYVQQRIEI